MKLSPSFKFINLFIHLLVPQVVGGIAGFITVNSVTSWYSRLNKPSFNPPNFIFGPVWTLLYILMGISSYLIWAKRHSFYATKSLFVYGIQLILNFSWSIVFFGLKLPLGAFINVLLLWISIISMIILFYKVDKKAAFLQVPYLLWVSFASVLNYFIVLLN
jgi:translocator protein